jgi:hypothetical protein
MRTCKGTWLRGKDCRGGEQSRDGRESGIFLSWLVVSGPALGLPSIIPTKTYTQQSRRPAADAKRR